MQSLERSDDFHLSAAQGWLELGDHLAADEELENITPSLRTHPDVLEMRWAIYKVAKNFAACEDIGRALVVLAPERPVAWRHRSAAIHFRNRSNEAYDLLAPALSLFPKDWPVHYDMACYAVVTGRMDEGRLLFSKALELSGGEAVKVKKAALYDPDLAALWQPSG